MSEASVNLEYGRLRLRELAGDDGGAVLAIFGDPVATERLSFEPRNREQVEKTVDHAMQTARAQPRAEYNLAVELRDTADLIGFGRLALEPHRAGQIGFALRADQWGQGLGLEMIQLILALGFDELGLHRIWGARSPLNIASRNAMLRAGMAEECHIRDHVYVHGAWRDSVTHTMLEQDWRDPAAQRQRIKAAPDSPHPPVARHYEP